MSRPRLLRATALLLAAALPACTWCSEAPAPVEPEPNPPPSGQDPIATVSGDSIGLAQDDPDRWTTVEEEPAWFGEPPAREGWWRFPQLGRSNGGPIARRNGEVCSERRTGLRLAELFGEDVRFEDVEDAGIAIAQAATPIRFAYRFRVIDEGTPFRPPSPGNTLAEAWVLFEVPMEVVLEALPAVLRERAPAVLANG